MGWSIGYDRKWKRDIGYGVPATCDHPGCAAEIDRGLTYVCGGQPYGGEFGCGLYFCPEHQKTAGDRRDNAPLCTRCYHGREPYAPTPDRPAWMRHKLRDSSWYRWRAENPDLVAAIRVALGERRRPTPAGATAC